MSEVRRGATLILLWRTTQAQSTYKKRNTLLGVASGSVLISNPMSILNCEKAIFFLFSLWKRNCDNFKSSICCKVNIGKDQTEFSWERVLFREIISAAFTLHWSFGKEQKRKLFFHSK